MLVVGNIVRLTKEAVDNFYAQDRHIDMFVLGGEFEVNKLDTDSFVDFVGGFLGFENGEFGGIVEKVIPGYGRTDPDTVTVRYFTPMGEWRTGFYDSKSLEVVME